MTTIEECVAEFNGAIKYAPMLQDHPDWTKDQCVAFSRKWHAVAQKQFAERGNGGWNTGIPYCRNDITKANL